MPNVVDSSVPFTYDTPVRSGYFQGYISNFRVTTGQALYTGNFTPPTASLTTSSVGAIGQTFEAQRTNLFTYSADFNDASWLKTRSGVTPNTVSAPDGTLTGDYFYANGTGVPYLYKQITLTQYQPYTMSCFVKQGDLPTPRVRLRDFTEAGSVVFDIVSGTITTGATGICSNPSIVDAGNGWFRISAVFTPKIATGNHNMSPVHIDDVAGAIFGFYCWGAQLDVGTNPTSYLATTNTPVAVGPGDAPATNLLSYSEEFNFINNIPWEKYQVTVRSNVAIAPNGTLTADKLVESTANTEHILFMRRSGRNETATLSVYAKSSERYIRLGFSNFINYASGATFNLFNGTVIAGSIDPNGSNPDYANPIPVIVSVGDGWYRCSFTVTKGSLQNTSNPYFDTVNPSSSNPVYAGDGSSGVFIWGAQLEIGSIATNYIPTFGAPATRSAGGVAAQINANSVAVLAFVDNSNVTTNFGSIPGVQFVSNTVTNPSLVSIKTGLDYNQPIVEPWQTSQLKLEYLDKIAVGDTIRITNATTGANVTTNVIAVNRDTITFTTIPDFTFTYTNNYTVQNLSTTLWPTAQVATTDWKKASTPKERLATQFSIGNKSLVKYPIITIGEVNVVNNRGHLNLYNRADLQGDNKFRVRNIISNTTFIGDTINLYLDDSDILTSVSANLTANSSVLQFETIGSVPLLYRDGNLRVTDNTTGVKTNVQIISSSLNNITVDTYFDSTSNLSIESRNVFAWPKLTQQPTTKPSSPREYLWFVENFPSYLRSRLDYPILVDPGRRESVVQRFKLLDKRSLHEPKIDLTTPTSLSFYSDFSANYQSTTITGISTVKYNVSDFYLNDEDVLTKTITDSATKILYIQPGTFNRWLLNSQVKIRDEVSGNVALYTVQAVQPNYIVINTTDTFASNILTLSRPVRETGSAFFANGIPRIGQPQRGVTEFTPLVNLYFATLFPQFRNRTYSYPGPAEVDVTQKLFLKTSLLNKDLDRYGRRGDFIYKVPGTYQWTAPSGITSVSVLAIGGGGGGSNYGDGGGGGGLGWGNVSVVPGQVYTIRVGAGGAGGERSTKESKGFTGGDSWFGSNTTVAGFGGTGGGLTLDNLGGGFVGQGGGWGGAGGKWTGLGYRAGAGGGGAGGFTGNGGRGGYSHTLSSIPTILATTSTGGGGGGGAGAYNSPYFLNYAGSAGGGGGGVGIYGNVGLTQELTLFSEGLSPAATIQYWSPQTTFYMDQFGGLGAGTAHGYSPSTSFYLTVPNLEEHDRIRYQFYWHFVDSPDNETNYLEIDGVRYLQFTKVYNAAGASSITINRCLTFTWVGNNTYSYSPWGGNGWANGYFIVDTGWISHTKSSVQINHFFGLDQAQTDEASYVSHATFQISAGSSTIVAGNIEPMTETVRYEPMNYFTTGTVTLTATDQNTEYSMFKSSGSVAWDSSVYSTTPFNAPCTIEFVKRADVGDNGVSYAMIGWNSDPLTNSSYDTLDYAAYPYRTDTYSVHHNGSQVLFTGSWNQSTKFYIVYDTDGYIRHYNGSKLLYSVFYGAGAGSYGSRTVYFDSSFNSVNSTFGGFRNVRVIRRAWNGTDYGAPSRVAARTIYDSPGYYLWTVPQGISKINVYLWGGGGAGGRPGGWSFGSPGGAGGAANATLDVVPGTTYYITVGSGGNYNSGDPLGVGGGGSAGFNGSDNQYGGGGGGYSGIFLTGTRTQSNALIIAGGGGGGGSSRAGTGNQGGAGGAGEGQDGVSAYDNKPLYRGRGGTQTAAGVDASSDGANTAGNQGALQGGNSRTNSYGGGGGGGYWGGSGGGYSEANTMAGGGGGSGYLNGSIISIGNLISGSLNGPGDAANPLRSTAGNAGAPSNLGSAGRVVIDLVITGGLPGWGGQYGTSGVNFKSDSMPVDGVAGGLYGGGGSGGSDPTSGIVNDAGYQVAGGAGADGAVRIVYGTNVYYPFNSNVNFTTGNTLIAQSNHQIISNRLSASSRDLLLLSVLAPGYRGRSITPFGKQLSDDRVIYRTISNGVGNFTSKLKLVAPILNESVTILKTRGFIKTVIGMKGIRDLLLLGNLRTPRMPYNEAATSLYLSKTGTIQLFKLNRASSSLFDIAERKKEPLSFWS